MCGAYQTVYEQALRTVRVRALATAAALRAMSEVFMGSVRIRTVLLLQLYIPLSASTSMTEYHDAESSQLIGQFWRSDIRHQAQQPDRYAVGAKPVGPQCTIYRRLQKGAHEARGSDKGRTWSTEPLATSDLKEPWPASRANAT